MIKLGEMQGLTIDRETDFGLYLMDRNEKDPKKERESILLPIKEKPTGAKKGDPIEVFIYRDSKDRLIATTRTPKILLGQLAPLQVLQITKVGAFLDWSLEKDLLLPYHEQIVEVKKGQSYLVYLYIDKSERLCATTKIYDHLKNDSTYAVNDWVEGYVYQMSSDLGALVAVENQYHGLIPKKDLDQDIYNGSQIKARITEVRPDGKLILNTGNKAYKNIPVDALTILKQLEAEGGFLPYNDHTRPDVIRKVFNMSKASFKRALGTLLKQHRIIQIKEGIQQKN